MCLTDTYSRVRVVKNLSYVVHISNVLKPGDALRPLLFNFVLDNAISWIQVNKDGLELNVTHQLLVCADDINILGERVHTVNKTQKLW